MATKKKVKLKHVKEWEEINLGCGGKILIDRVRHTGNGRVYFLRLTISGAAAIDSYGNCLDKVTINVFDQAFPAIEKLLKRVKIRKLDK